MLANAFPDKSLPCNVKNCQHPCLLDEFALVSLIRFFFGDRIDFRGVRKKGYRTSQNFIIVNHHVIDFRCAILEFRTKVSYACEGQHSPGRRRQGFRLSLQRNCIWTAAPLGPLGPPAWPSLKMFWARKTS